MEMEVTEREDEIETEAETAAPELAELSHNSMVRISPPRTMKLCERVMEQEVVFSSIPASISYLII